MPPKHAGENDTKSCDWWFTTLIFQRENIHFARWVWGLEAFSQVTLERLMKSVGCSVRRTSVCCVYQISFAFLKVHFETFVLFVFPVTSRGLILCKCCFGAIWLVFPLLSARLTLNPCHRADILFTRGGRNDVCFCYETSFWTTLRWCNWVSAVNPDPCGRFGAKLYCSCLPQHVKTHILHLMWPTL